EVYMSILFRRDTLSCVLAVTLVFSGTVLAQPKPSDVEYNDSQGEIVITGSAFGSGPNVMLFDNFEHGSKFSDLLSSKSNSWIGDVLLQTEASGNKAKKAKDPSRNTMSQMIINFGRHYTEAFMSFSVKTPAGTTFPAASTTKTFPKDSSWKFVWLMSGTRGFDAGGGFDVCLPSHVGSGNFLLGGNDGNLTWLEKGSNWWEWDNYNHMSSYVKFSSSQPSTGPVEYFWSVTNNLKTLRSSGETAASQFRSSDFGFD